MIVQCININHLQLSINSLEASRTGGLDLSGYTTKLQGRGGFLRTAIRNYTGKERSEPYLQQENAT